MPTTWECPHCRRRVPLSVEECRCGALRPRPGAPVNRPLGDGSGRFAWKDVPRPVIISLGVAALAVVVTIVWAILSPPPHIPLLPLLGYMDRPVPTPPPTRPKPPTPLPQAISAPSEPASDAASAPTPEPAPEVAPEVAPESTPGPP